MGNVIVDSLCCEVTLRVVPDRIENERLAEEHLDFVVRPVLCRQGLQEHNDALRVKVENLRARYTHENLQRTWKSIARSLSLHRTRNAEQTYKWN